MGNLATIILYRETTHKRQKKKPPGNAEGQLLPVPVSTAAGLALLAFLLTLFHAFTFSAFHGTAPPFARISACMSAQHHAAACSL